MQMMAQSPASAYRRIELDARIEASAGEDLTVICLEEAVAALGQALHALKREPSRPPREPLTRAHGIAVWLTRGVADDNPLRSALLQFYGGLAATIAQNISRTSVSEIAQVREDFVDLLGAAKVS